MKVLRKHRSRFIIFLIMAQIFDALFTYAGVMLMGHGTNIEGNPLVKYVMDAIGPLLGLLILKGICVLLLLGVYKKRHFFDHHRYFFEVACLIVLVVYGIVLASWIYAFLTMELHI